MTDHVKNGGRFKPKHGFTAVPNDVLRSDMSLSAKGLYGIIQSYITMDNFVLFKSFLEKRVPEGSRAFNTAWNELKAWGLLKQTRLRGSDNRFYYEYELLDIPVKPETTEVDNEENTESPHTPFAPVGDDDADDSPSIPFEPVGNVPVNNNTINNNLNNNLNNTLSNNLNNNKKNLNNNIPKEKYKKEKVEEQNQNPSGFSSSNEETAFPFVEEDTSFDDKQAESGTVTENSNRVQSTDVSIGYGYPTDTVSIPYNEIVDYLNLKSGKKYRVSTDKTRKLIKARFKEGFTLDDFKKVIDNKCRQWKGTQKWDGYLRPLTLFGNNFEGYLNEVEGFGNVPAPNPQTASTSHMMTDEEIARHNAKFDDPNYNPGLDQNFELPYLV